MSNIPKELDQNMIVSADAEGFVWYDAANLDLYGFAGAPGDTYRRLPADVAEATNPGTARNASHTCGGRVFGIRR